MLRLVSGRVRPELGRVALASADYSLMGVQQKKSASGYSQLPKLPVPDPKRTLTHFLEFSKALQNQKEFAQTQKIVNDFAQNELPTLQKLLEERASKLNNWLTPWWLNVAYLASRDPLPVVTSPGVLFPRFNFDGLEGQIEYAAKITHASLQFCGLAMSNQLPEDKAGPTPFDMSQYKFLFGTTRVPRENADEIRYGVSNENQGRHILVMRNGHAFKVPVFDKSGKVLSLEELKTKFSEVASQSSEKNPHQIGIVSSDNRDTWAKVYRQLEAHSVNSDNIRSIEDALFVVCLDEKSEPPKDFNERDEQARQSLHGGGAEVNSGNRWFDKTIQFVVGSNGYCGMTYEHTPAEGPPVAALMDFVCDKINGKDGFESGVSSSEKVKRLDFELADEQIQQISKSSKHMNAVVRDLEVIAYTFKRFGKNIPKQMKISPDSFIQLAFQLAYFRIHQNAPPTYETATLRKFDEGRTENIRSPNTRTVDFCRKITEGRRPIEELYDALKTATDSHKKYTMDCMNGAGMDRHLLAWNLLASENNLPKPSILQSPVYQALSHYQVSTSQVPTRNFIQMCFGPSAADCYGICYNPQEHEFHFTISTFKHYGSTSSKRFAKELEKALNDMAAICLKYQKIQSKL